MMASHALRSPNAGIRANALEFLDNVLDPQLRHLVVPLLDPQTPLAERVSIADRLVGTPVRTVEGGIHALMSDPRLRDVASEALRRLAQESTGDVVADEPEPVPADVGLGV